MRPSYNSKLNLNSCLKIAANLAAALAEVHRREFVHRDIRPGNVLVDDLGSARLMGFGFAAPLPLKPPTLEDPIAGTLAYISPEQTGRMGRAVDHRSDLYSFGVTLYEMLTGSLPFTAQDAIGLIHLHVAQRPPPLSNRTAGVPPQVEALVLKLMAKAPESRYRSAESLERDLKRCISDLDAGRPIMSFVLDQGDPLKRLQVPNRLYGREVELRTLFAAFEGVARGGGKVTALISGAPGIGKSSLANELRTRVSLRKGLSVAGKFDQLKRDAPYATVAQAFAPLIANLLGTPQSELNEWRARLLDALGANGQIMTNLIPQLALIIGEQPPVADISPLSRQQRLQIVTRRFVEVFARPGQPLLWILDDLQWSDTATLELIEDLAKHQETENLVIVVAYRDDEIGPSHMVQHALTQIRSVGSNVVEIKLAPLGVETLQQMVAHAFTSSEGEVGQLTNLMFRQTRGNPYFSLQYLSMLEESGLAAFDAHQSRWTWDIAGIQARDPEGDVVELISEKLNGLTHATSEMLRLMACIGGRAEVAVMAAISERSQNACHHTMRAAVRAGLVSRDGHSYAFIHDWIQESVYAAIPICDRPGMHLRIGRALQASDLAMSSTERVFEIVDQMNRGRAAIHEEADLTSLLNLNRLAASRAKDSAAYDAALAYVALANEILMASGPTLQIAFKFELDLLQAECLFLTGAVDAAENLLVGLESRCKTKVDNAAVACLAVDVYMFRSDLSRAVDTALRCLKLFGVDLPRNPKPGDFDEYFDRLWKKFDVRTIESLAHLPRSTDEEVEAAMRVLTALFPPAAFHNMTLLHINLCYMVELTLQHGFMEASAAGLAWFGMVLGSVRGRYDEGYRLARVAADLVDTHHFPANRAKTLLALHHVSAWVRPIPEIVEMLRVAFPSAVSIGDLSTACFCCVNLANDRLFQCDDLQSVQEEVNRGLQFAGNAGMRDVVDFLVVEDRYLKNMKGETFQFSSFDGDDFDTASFERTLTPGRMQMMIFFYWTLKGAAKFIAGHFAEALEALSRASPLLHEASGQPQRMLFHYYCALTLLAVERSDGGSENDRAGQILAHLQPLSTWAVTCPSTFSDKAALICAERARNEGRQLEAMHLYEEAIRLARQHGMVKNEGIGNELAGEFYLSLGLMGSATAHFANAAQCYRAWGAHGKVKQLEARFPLLNLSALAVPAFRPGLSLDRLDRATIVSISQSISSEIDLTKLVERLTDIALQHSGGERAVFVHAEDDVFWIGAERPATKASIGVELQRIPVTEFNLPISIIRHAMRSGEIVTVSDTSGNNPYSGDLYFQNASCRSLICVPLVRGKTTIGVIYVENRSVTDAFRKEGNDVLELISSQAAISIENAKLYKDRERMILSARQAESELRLTMNLTPVHVWSVYSSGLGGEFNNRWHEYTGISPDVARGGGWLEAFHPDDRAKVSAKWLSMVQSGDAGEIEARLLARDGTSRSFLVRATPLRNEDGDVVKWYGTHIDIDDIRQAEQAQEALARASRLTTIGELTVSIAHEINQPLMAIVTNAAACLQWLRKGRINISEARRAAERINADGHRAGAAIASIRSLAKKSIPIFAEFNINEVIDEVLVIMRGELQRRSITVETEREERAALALGDRVQIQQVVLNLLMNGIEAMNSSANVPRDIHIETREAEPGFVQVRVSDTGSGLDSSNGDKIFEPFFTTKPEGLGIGLSICRSIVEAHGGRLWASPNLPFGSVFHFTIPTFSPGHKIGQSH